MRLLLTAGCVMILAAALVLYLLMLRYVGYFDDKVEVTALLTSTGDGLAPRADVKFRGITVGAVSGVDIVAKGEVQRVGVDLDPHFAVGIPDNVTARVIPGNIFGVTAVEFLDIEPSSAMTLRGGAEIPEDTSEATIALQTTLTTLRNVLDHIQPEKLGRVLGTLADALDSKARVPGSTIERLDTWLTSVDAAIPDLGKFLGDFGKAATGLNESAPELIDALGASVATATTLTQRRSNLVALLTTATGAIDSVNTLFDRNPDSGKELTVGVDQLFGSLAAEPDALPDAVANLNVALRNLATAFHWGPQMQMAWSVDLSLTPFRQYTAADCPRYSDMYGPRCGGPSVPSVAPQQDYSVVKPIAQQNYPTGNDSAGLRGPAAVAAIVGGAPTASQLLLLGSAINGGSLHVGDSTVPATEGGN